MSITIWPLFAIGYGGGIIYGMGFWGRTKLTT
jgi:hypothetical protein